MQDIDVKGVCLLSWHVTAYLFRRFWRRCLVTARFQACRVRTLNRSGAHYPARCWRWPMPLHRTQKRPKICNGHDLLANAPYLSGCLFNDSRSQQQIAHALGLYRYPLQLAQAICLAGDGGIVQLGQ